MFLKCRESLFAQGNTIDKEQDSFGMTGSHQCVGQSNAGSGFTGPGCHDQQEVSLLLFNAFQHSTDGSNLVVTTCDVGVDQFLSQRLSISANVLHPFQIIASWKADNLARRIVFKVPEKELVAVGVKAEGQFAAVLFLNVVAVLLSLLATDGGINAEFLRFDNGERLTVFSEERVIAVPSGLIRFWLVSDSVVGCDADSKFRLHLTQVRDVPSGRGEPTVNDLSTGVFFVGHLKGQKEGRTEFFART